MIPSPADSPLGLVLTCGSDACPHIAKPDPIASVGAQSACPSAYLTDHAAACLEIGELAYLLLLVVQLAEDADGMTASVLREEIRRIAGMARDKASVQRARQVVNGDA
ncbi:MAG: hypothetical protein LC799_16850 [Actinobacteria bacterium]|nr:hypothetical protein [Actinomycetota bacterium]